MTPVKICGITRFEDAMLAGDSVMAHSRLSVPLNLGLLHPLEVVDHGGALLVVPVRPAPVPADHEEDPCPTHPATC